jgi:predicted MPP superfamily phosphohydrolase
MKTVFIFIALSILLSINSYVVIRGWQALPVGSSIRPIYLVSAIGLFLLLVVGMIFGSEMPQSIAKVITFIGFTYIIVFVYLMISFLIVDVIRIANYFFHFLPAGMATFRLWAMAGTLAITAIALVIGNYKFNHPQTVTFNISSDKPTQNKTLKIVAASDLHLGINIDKKRLQSYVKMINDQRPDIVLLAGDISDRLVMPIINQKMIEELSSIKATKGVYAINGNHEHYAEKPDITAEYLTLSGIKVLRDETFLVDSSFYIVGRDDKSNLNRKKLSEIVTGLDKKLPIILMDHQPYHLEEAEQNGIDFQISGHTHNGQFFPGNLFVKRMYELGYGYLKKGNTHYYVSSGLGLWGPQYRIGTESELVVINMKY